MATVPPGGIGISGVSQALRPRSELGPSFTAWPSMVADVTTVGREDR